MRTQIVFLLVLVLRGCKSIEGNYNPDCAAFAGDSIELHAGRFTWTRFTDEVRVDNAGNKIDPFPDFPKSGTYVVNGDQVELRVDGDETPAIYMLQAHEGRTYLLTATQQKHFTAEGVIERCSLVLDDTAKK